MIPSEVLVHVPDVAKGLKWYKKAFPEAVPIYHSDFDFTVLDLNGISLEIVEADEKVGAGKNGTCYLLVCRQLICCFSSLRSTRCVSLSWSNGNRK